MTDWQPPETAPKDGKPFLITMAGPNVDLCCWVEERQQFEDYFHKQKIAPEWPYMVAWRPVGQLARVCNSEVESRRENGWTGDDLGIVHDIPPRS
jgi:hypothetical protein